MFRLSDVSRAIRAGRWTIILGMLVGLTLAAALSATTVRTYESSTKLFVSVTRTPDAPSAYQGALFTQERMDSYAEILTTAQLAQQVVDDLGIPLTANQVVSKVNVVPLPKTDILAVTVTDTSASRAQAIAASLGRKLSEQVSALETSDAAQGPTVKVSPIEPATYEPAPVSPVVPRYLVLGAALGLVGGLGIALVRQQSDKTVRDDSDIRDASGTALVSRLFKDRQLSKPPATSHVQGGAAMAQAFRALRLNLQHASGAGSPQVIAVTSPAAGEGKSTVAVGLSIALARSGSRVVLVDGNLWRPRLTRYLGLAATDKGLTDVLNGSLDVTEATVSSSIGGLGVLPAGPMPADSAEAVGSAQMESLLQGLRESYDYILIDCPPLLPLVDAVALSALSDGVLLVTSYGKTKRDELAGAATAIAAVNTQLLGVVLNRVPMSAITPAGRQKYSADSGRTVGAPSDTVADLGHPDTDHDEPDVLPAGSGRP